MRNALSQCPKTDDNDAQLRTGRDSVSCQCCSHSVFPSAGLPLSLISSGVGVRADAADGRSARQRSSLSERSTSATSSLLSSLFPSTDEVEIVLHKKACRVSLSSLVDAHTKFVADHELGYDRYDESEERTRHLKFLPLDPS